jgi:hypothetical protein
VVGVSGGEGAAGRAPAGPLQRTPAPAALDDALVVDALSRLAGAASRADAADAVLPLLLDVPGVRAAAVVVRDGDRAVVVGSAGYGCGPMSPGAELPLSAGLPVTECVRTGRTVVQGNGPSWVAVPLGGRAGGLLLSMTTAPVQLPAELARLHRIARGLGDALHRAGEQERAAAELAVVASRLAAGPAPDGITVRSLPHAGPAGGDLALCLPDGRGGRWLLVADVCGSGLPAAVVAGSVQATFTALAPYVDGPAALLAAADRALRTCVRPGLFVTALAAHERQGRLRVASAGHPALLLVRSGGAVPVEVEPGLPLALESEDGAVHEEEACALLGDEVLLLHSDGLVDRRTAAGAVTADPLALVHGLPSDDLEVLAEAVLAAAEELGAAGDDVTLLLARPLH